MRKIEFNRALALIHGLIGSDVQIVVNLPGYFFDCGFRARLERVETLADDQGPVLIVFGRGQGIALDPTEATVYRAGSADRGGEWLEFHFGDAARLVIEPRRPFDVERSQV